MSRRNRSLIAGLLILVGVPVALIFGGGGVAMCLGPVGVTEVECARNTGLFSNVGLGPPLLALVAAVALFALVPVPARDRLVVLGSTAAGAVLGGVLFLALWPRTLDGLDSRGAWLSVPRPLDGWALLTAVIAGAALAFGVAAGIAISRDRRAA